MRPDAKAFIEAAAGRGLTIATCESLTAGLIAASLADVPGASAVLRGGLVTYATSLKHELAGVDAALLAHRGAVDPDVARQMARGACTACSSDFGISCTGVAGPDPQDGQPLGRVFIGFWNAAAGEGNAEQFDFSGSRAEIRSQVVDAALGILRRELGA